MKTKDPNVQEQLLTTNDLKDCKYRDKIFKALHMDVIYLTFAYGILCIKHPHHTAFVLWDDVNSTTPVKEISETTVTFYS